MKRMREYAEEGIEHFYFMMLQKDEVSSTTFFPYMLICKPNVFVSTRVVVHRCNEARRDRAFRESFLQPELLRRQVDDRAARSDGHFLESHDQEGRGIDVQLQRRSLWVNISLTLTLEVLLWTDGTPVTKRSHVIAAKTSVLVSSAGRHKRI